MEGVWRGVRGGLVVGGRLDWVEGGGLTGVHCCDV